MSEITVFDLAEWFSYLEPMPPITKANDHWGTKRPSQKIHMVEWLQWQAEAADGAYGRQKANTSAEKMYNRFQNPGGLLWMAEVLGEDQETLLKAVEAATQAQQEAKKYNGKTRCAAFRKVIPWQRIEVLLQNPEGWLYDQKLEGCIEIKYGKPRLKRGTKPKFEQVYCTEAGY